MIGVTPAQEFNVVKKYDGTLSVKCLLDPTGVNRTTVDDLTSFTYCNVRYAHPNGSFTFYTGLVSVAFIDPKFLLTKGAEGVAVTVSGRYAEGSAGYKFPTQFFEKVGCLSCDVYGTYTLSFSAPADRLTLFQDESDYHITMFTDLWVVPNAAPMRGACTHPVDYDPRNFQVDNEVNSTVYGGNIYGDLSGITKKTGL